MGGTSSSGWQASARQPREGERGVGGCERGRGCGGSGEAGRGREGGKGGAHVAEARGEPGIILCLSCFCRETGEGDGEGIDHTRNLSCQNRARRTHGRKKRRPLQEGRCARGSGGKKSRRMMEEARGRRDADG